MVFGGVGETIVDTGAGGLVLAVVEALGGGDVEADGLGGIGCEFLKVLAGGGVVAEFACLADEPLDGKVGAGHGFEDTPVGLRPLRLGDSIAFPDPAKKVTELDLDHGFVWAGCCGTFKNLERRRTIASLEALVGDHADKRHGGGIGGVGLFVVFAGDGFLTAKLLQDTV